MLVDSLGGIVAEVPNRQESEGRHVKHRTPDPTDTETCPRCKVTGPQDELMLSDNYGQLSTPLCSVCADEVLTTWWSAEPRQWWSVARREFTDRAMAAQRAQYEVTLETQNSAGAWTPLGRAMEWDTLTPLGAAYRHLAYLTLDANTPLRVDVRTATVAIDGSRPRWRYLWVDRPPADLPTLVRPETDVLTLIPREGETDGRD